MSSLKRQFYENHSGSSISEINSITLIILLGHTFFHTLQQNDFVTGTRNEYFWSFVCYVLNVLLGTTLVSDHHWLLILIYGISISALLSWAQRSQRQSKHEKDRSSKATSSQTLSDSRDALKSETSGTLPPKARIQFLSVYRATMMITTLICILAVDLPMFPRRYAKSETFGTSLMDLGVGSFVFSSGLVSARSQAGFMKGLRQGGVVLALGFIRALMVRGSGYHEHVSEYGTHWNFFITLSLLPPLLPLFGKMKSLGLDFKLQGWLVCVLYQLALSATDWQHWILSAPRIDLISANKEGISSFIGYIAIFLFGLDIGAIVLEIRLQVVVQDSGIASLTTALLKASLLEVVAYFVMKYMKVQVSRRIANAPYIMWVVAHNTTFVLSLALIERYFGDAPLQAKTALVSRASLLLEQINKQGLRIFLAANLLTGAINLAMGDAMMTTNELLGFCIMLTYTGLLCIAASYG